MIRYALNAAKRFGPGALAFLTLALAPATSTDAAPRFALAAQEEAGPPDPEASQARAGTQDALRVRLNDGTVLYGTIVRETDEEIELSLTSGGSVVLERTAIKEMQTVQGVLKDGSFLPPDPNSSRLFWGPTARTLPQGDGYFGVYEVVIPFLTIGVTDWLTMGGGLPLIFSPEAGVTAFWLAPKVRILHREKLDVSLGSFVIIEPDANESYGAVHYGVLTAGDERASFTIGGGILDGGFEGPPVFMAGGQIRASRSMTLMAEGYLYDGEGLVIVGPRFMGERLSADVGLGVPVTAEGLIVFPVVNFSYAW